MLGSRTVNERINILKKTEKIIFNSNWSRSRFLDNLPIILIMKSLSLFHNQLQKLRSILKKRKK